MIAEQQRQMMVDGQIRINDVTQPALLEALYATPRESFLPESFRDVAYTDREVALDSGRVLLTPLTLAKLIQALDISSGSKVLDIAGATGYGAALMRAMGANVTTVETAQGGGTSAALEQGAPANGPFDAILIEGAVDDVPASLLNQLTQNGKLVTVVGSGRAGRATEFERSGTGFGSRILFDAIAPKLAAFTRAPSFSF